MAFKDHFSGHAAAYRHARPDYPDELFAYIASLTPTHELAIDCACGNGQASAGLAQHYAQVIGNDASVQQIRQSPARSNILLLACTAERQALRAGVADVFAVAQAAHWLDFVRFYPEVRRVLKPDGALVLCGYGLARVEPAIDAVVQWFYKDVVGQYWPPERRYLEEEYRTLPFALAEIPAPQLSMTHAWTLDEYLAYIETWSAVQRYRSARRADPLPDLRSRLTPRWNSTEARRSVVWPLYLRVGYP
ncbi:MAG: class I SAM-dependent methyltransferase [Steroidobacteraceae bacterium]